MGTLAGGAKNALALNPTKKSPLELLETGMFSLFNNTYIIS